MLATQRSGSPLEKSSKCFRVAEDVGEDDKRDTSAAGHAPPVRAHDQNGIDNAKHDFLNINFDDQISNWSVALDRVFGTGTTIDHDDGAGASSGPDTEPSPGLLPAQNTPEGEIATEPTLRDDSDSLSGVSSTGTVHLGIPTLLSHARASLVGTDVQEAPVSAATEVFAGQPLSSAEQDTLDISDQEDEEAQPLKSDPDLAEDAPFLSGPRAPCDASLEEGSTGAEPPALPEAMVKQDSSQTTAKSGISRNRVDSVQHSDNASIPVLLARKNSWTQADVDHEDAMGAYKKPLLEPEGLSRNRAATLEPKRTDDWDEKKVALRSSACRNGKRASRVARSLTARPVLEQTVDECLDVLAESARCGVSPSIAGVEHQTGSQQRSSMKQVVTPKSPHGGYSARMSIDDWQEQQTRTKDYEVDEATKVYFAPETAGPRKPTTFTDHKTMPLCQYSSAFTIEASPQYGPMDHQMSTPKAQISEVGPSDRPAHEAPARLDTDSVSVIRRTLTSASKVSYATTMSKASSADSSTTVKLDKAQGLSPTMSPPSTPPKLVLIGDPRCGKTAIARRFAYDDFNEAWGGIGAYNYDMAVTTDRPDHTIQIDFWDTAGQEEFFPLRQLAYNRPRCILICFAIDSRDSFDNVAHAWIQEVLDDCRDVLVLLIGCKSDLRKTPLASKFTERLEPALVEREQGAKLASSIGAEKYIECSAKDNDAVVEVFEPAVQLGLAQRTKKRRKRKSLLNLFASH